MNIYKLLYFGFFDFYKKTRNFSDISASSASFLLSGLLSLNIITFSKGLGFHYWKHIQVELFALLIFISLIFLNYLIFLKNDNYKKLLEQIGQTKKERNLRAWVTFFYTLITIVLLLIV